MLLIFFGFVVVRIGVAKPPTTIKVAKIPAGSEYDTAAWEKFYPLQHASFMKNKVKWGRKMAISAVTSKYQHSEKQPEILVNFKGYLQHRLQ